MSERLRELVAGYYGKLYSAQCEAAMAAHLAPEYTEHQYTAEFSREGLCRYVAARRRDNPDHAVVIHQTLSDGDFVFLFVEEKLAAGLDYARAELFRLAGERIVEHWGSAVADDKNRKNPNGTFDGTRVDRARDYARRFVEEFEALDRRGFDCQEIETFEISRAPDYRQHSPKGGDGRHGLVEILSKAKEAGIRTTMTRLRTLCDGDFIVSHRLYDTRPTHPLMNRIYTFDVFRMDAQGRAVEHWDVMEPVPSESLLQRMR